MTEKIQQMLQELEKGGVKFLPWIGDEYEEGIYYDEKGELCYGNGKGKKILILNEYIYIGKTEKDAFNCVGQEKLSYLIYKIIERFIDSQSNFHYGINHRSYIQFERALVGAERLTLNERTELWNHVAFYTYIQDPITEVNHFDLTEKQYEDSKKALLTLIEKCQPNIIIIWGRRLYDKLPLDGQQGEDISIKDEYTETWNFFINHQVVRILPIPHPSYAGFISSNWHEIIEKSII